MTRSEIYKILDVFIDADNKDLRFLNESFRAIVGYLNDHFEDQELIIALVKWPDELKTLIIQQFFRHDQQGSHQTRFDIKKVNCLLSEWFHIQVEEDPTNHSGGSSITHFPGRISDQGIYKVGFGDTQFYFHIGIDHYLAAQKLIFALCENTVLTVEKTSPPCEMSEIVPLWLKDRSLDPSSYYIQAGQDHVIGDYFTSVKSSLKQDLGFEILYPSTEMAIITNGDALRFHRDRLVNQYQFLDSHDELRNQYSIAQCLTLMSWDMQEDTLSGTIFDHPDGNRFVICLYPNEIVNIIFIEDAKPVGPMMMPYHCALPVVDLLSGRSVGAAKGKRFSTVLRGLVKKQSINSFSLHAKDLTLTIEANNGKKDFALHTALEETCFSELRNPTGSFNQSENESVSIIEISSSGNESFFKEIEIFTPGKVKIFRLIKHSPGFASLSAIVPDYISAKRVICINRSKNCPGGTLSYPLALDFAAEHKPWIQLIPVNYGHAFEIFKEHRPFAKLSPAEELFHRSALTDSFHQFSSAKLRMSIIVDIALID